MGENGITLIFILAMIAIGIYYMYIRARNALIEKEIEKEKEEEKNRNVDVKTKHLYGLKATGVDEWCNVKTQGDGVLIVNNAKRKTSISYGDIINAAAYKRPNDVIISGLNQSRGISIHNDDAEMPHIFIIDYSANNRERQLIFKGNKHEVLVDMQNIINKRIP